MVQIVKATPNDINLITQLGKTTFFEAHSTSGTKEDLEAYLNKAYEHEAFLEELNDPKNIYYLIYFNDQPAGFSKIVLDRPDASISNHNVTKLDRIYILKEYYDKKLGVELFNFNLELSKKSNQKGMWLYVWIKNERAIIFYKKMGFEIVGSYDFVLSKTKSNPNHIMFLEY